MDSGLETAILAALPADMDHRITFSTLMDRMRLAAGAAVSYSEISDLVDDLVTAGRVACWEFEDDGWKTYSLPQPAELEPRATDIVDWQSRALAAEAEVGRLRRAIGAGLDEAADAPVDRADSTMDEEQGEANGRDAVGEAIRSNLTPADLAALEAE